MSTCQMRKKHPDPSVHTIPTRSTRRTQVTVARFMNGGASRWDVEREYEQNRRKAAVPNPPPSDDDEDDLADLPKLARP